MKKQCVGIASLCLSCSVVSDSLRPHGLGPARLLCPWNPPGRNTGEGSHFLLQGIFLIQGLNRCPPAVEVQSLNQGRPWRQNFKYLHMGPKHRLPFSLKSPRKATSFTGNVLQDKHVSPAFPCHTLGSVLKWASPVAHMVKNLPAIRETRVQSLDQEDPLEKGMATHSSILAWRIPWTEEPGGLQPVRSQRVGHDWVTHTHKLL